jgi:hypothetical protein
VPATTPKKVKSEPVERVVKAHNIVGQSGIAKRFGISSQAAWNWTQREGFPAPLPGTDCGRPVWDWEEIVNWEKNWVRSKGGYHTHRGHQNGEVRRQWKEGDPT